MQLKHKHGLLFLLLDPLLWRDLVKTSEQKALEEKREQTTI